MKNTSLSEKYKSKLRTPDDAVRLIGAGQRVFIGSPCGEPQHLVNALMDNAEHFLDVEIVRLLSLESSLLALMADEYRGHRFHVRSIYQGSDQTQRFACQQTIYHSDNPFGGSRVVQERIAATSFCP